MIDIGDLLPYENNPKKHPKGQVDLIKNSILEYGQTTPILVDEDNVILAGHGRFLALQQLGKEKVWISKLTGLSDKQKKAYRLLDNKVAESEWDIPLLQEELREISSEIPELELLGFSKEELDNLLKEEKKEFVAIEEDPELVSVEAYERAKSITKIKYGDVYELGNHRLMCGDSTKEESVKLLLDRNIPILMVTDPPYGVNYNPQWRQDEAEKGNLNYGARQTDKLQNDDIIDWTEAYKLFPGNVAYVWHASYFTNIVADNLKALDYKIISQIIWVKPHFCISRGDYHWQHEPCWYVVKKGSTHNWQGSRKESTIWEITNNSWQGKVILESADESVGHSTQKPIECMARPIENNTTVGERVYDPFGGSGSTLIAAEQLRRRCFMMELDPVYCQIIINRWEKLTGKKAVKLEVKE